MAEAQLKQYFSRNCKGRKAVTDQAEPDEPSSVLLTPEHTPVKDEDSLTSTQSPCRHVITAPANQRKTRGKVLHFKELPAPEEGDANGEKELESSEWSSENDEMAEPAEVKSRALCRSNSDSILDSPKPTKAKMVRCERKTKPQTTEVKTSTGRPPKPGKASRSRKTGRKNAPPQCNGAPPPPGEEKSKHRSQSVPPNKKPAGGNHLVTDYYPIRRSARVPHSMLKKKEQSDVEEAILSRCEDGLEVVDLTGKGRGVVATKVFNKGDFVVEYLGDLISLTAAKKREQQYSNNSEIGCYMYYFSFRNRTYCVDATAESGRLGRLLNHSKSLANCSTKVVPIKDTPHLIIVAARDIQVGEELLYDYGDRSKTSLESHPWLAS